jgi:hypothetical protein
MPVARSGVLRGLFRRRRDGGEGSGVDEATPPASRAAVVNSPPFLVDAHTRTFWSHGASASETLIEAAGDGANGRSLARRVAALLSEKRAAVSVARTGRRGTLSDPAFSEALFVELMREGRYDRAFAQLAPECQESWGSQASFAAQHAGDEHERVLGVEVRAVRILPQWTDPRRGHTHREVAELEVAYAVQGRGGPAVLPRTVHLLSVGGHWRSLCYAQ